MKNGISVVIATSACGPALLSTLDTLARQQQAPNGIAVCYGRQPDGKLPRLLAAVADRPGICLVAGPPERPGAWWNAALDVVSGDALCWISEGDLLDARLLRLSATWLATCDVVLPLSLKSTRSGEGWTEPEIVVPAATLGHLLQDVERTPVAPVFRRALIETIGSVDESLGALEEYEFWIRAFNAGAARHTIPLPLVTRPLQVWTKARTTLEARLFVPAFSAVVTKHEPLFRQDPAGVLAARARALREVVDRHRESVARRDRLEDITANEKVEIARLREFLRENDAEHVEWGDLRQPFPISADWGYDRGNPIDRHYIEQFIRSHAQDLRGTVLEVQESHLSQRFGGDRVTRADVLDVNPSNAGATVIADLRWAPHIPSNSYDCFVLTQTLHVIDDMPAVLRECYRILKPGGVLLVTIPAASRVCLEYGSDGDFWRVTEAGARHIFATAFQPEDIDCIAYGNVLVNTAFLYGLGEHELSQHEYDAFDPYFPALIGVRAIKPGAAEDAASPTPALVAIGHERPQPTGVVLLYHRVANLPTDVHGLSISPAVFRRQMSFLKRFCRTLPLDQLLTRAEAGELPEHAVAITFDDGYVDNLTEAAAILVEMGLPATFFLTSQALHGRPEYWWDTLERLLLCASRLPPFIELQVADERHVLPCTTSADRRLSHQRVHRLLVDASLDVRDACLADLEAMIGEQQPHSASLMNGAQIQRLAQLPGCAIGAHTVHHLGLPAQSAADIAREFAENKRDLEHLIGAPVTAVAYPYGYYNDEVADLARSAGFATAVTCDVGVVRAGVDAMTIPRVEIKALEAHELAALLNRTRDDERPDASQSALPRI